MSLAIIDRWGNDISQERAITTTSSLTAPADWLIEALGGATTVSGIPVNRTMALTVSSVWKAAALIATDMARAPLNLYQSTGRSKEIVTDHPSAFLLRHEPNEQQTAFDYKQMRTLHKLLYGNSYAFKVMDGAGRVQGLIPLLPENVQRRDTRNGPVYDAMLYYENDMAEVYELDASQIIHETWISHDGVTGVGVLGVAREVLARIIAMRNYGASVFKNSARPATVIKRATEFKTEALREAFIASWERMYSGTSNAHKTAVLPPGTEIQTLGTAARDAQFIEQEQQCVRDVANFFMMPASKLNDMSKSSYNSLEQDNLAYFSDCLEGHLVSMEESCNKNLLTKQERMAGLAFEFDRSKIRVADLKTLGDYYMKMLGNNQAAMTPNEVRAAINLNPIEGGDDLPRSMAAPASAPAEMPSDAPIDTPDEGDPELADSVRAVHRDAIQRVVTRLVEKAKRGYKDSGEVGALAAVDCRECDRVKEMIGPALRVVARTLKNNPANEGAITIELFAAVREAAKKGPDLFAESLNELTAGIAERLAA